MDTLFLSGHTYYNRIKTKSQEQQTWYEKLYILYYENFKTILLILACVILYKFINIQHCSNNKGERLTGGFNFGKGIKSRISTYTKADLSSKATKNLDKIKGIPSSAKGKASSAWANKGKLLQTKTYTSAIGTAGKYGIKGLETGAEYGKAGIAYGADQFREKSEFIYKYIAMIFIGIGFSVYIFPVLAMFLIGALTFLIVRKSIAGVITM
jgi:hypothetical protein